MDATNPFDEIEQLLGRTPFAGERAWGRDLRTADIDVAEYDDEYVVMADLPGFDRDEIDVRALEDRLTIAAGAPRSARTRTVDTSAASAVTSPSPGPSTSRRPPASTTRPRRTATASSP